MVGLQLFTQTLGGMVIIGLLVREWFTLKYFMGGWCCFSGGWHPSHPPSTRVLLQITDTKVKRQDKVRTIYPECNQFKKIARHRPTLKYYWPSTLRALLPYRIWCFYKKLSTPALHTLMLKVLFLF